MTKNFSIGAIGSVMTNCLMCPFGELHECAEWIMGYPIWTHEFADRGLAELMRAIVLQQHPALEGMTRDSITPDTWQAVLAEWQDRYGKTVAISRGQHQRAMSPIESAAAIAPGMQVIVV